MQNITFVLNVCLQTIFSPPPIREIRGFGQEDGDKEQIVVKMNLWLARPKVCDQGMEELSHLFFVFLTCDYHLSNLGQQQVTKMQTSGCTASFCKNTRSSILESQLDHKLNLTYLLQWPRWSHGQRFPIHITKDAQIPLFFRERVEHKHLPACQYKHKFHKTVKHLQIQLVLVSWYWHIILRVQVVLVKLGLSR